MSRLDKFEEILKEYEGRECKKDIVTCNDMLFVLGELALGDPPVSENLYKQIIDGTFDIIHNNDDKKGYCGLNYNFDNNEFGERRWGWCTKKEALLEICKHKFEKYDACIVPPEVLHNTICGAEGKLAVLLLMNERLSIEKNIRPILEKTAEDGNKVGVIHIVESPARFYSSWDEFADVFYAHPETNINKLMQEYGNHVLNGKEKPRLLWTA